MPFMHHLISAFAHTVLVIRQLAADFARLAMLSCRSRGALAAENLFLRKQLALFQERKAKPRRTTDATRVLMALLSRLFDWRNALVVVKTRYPDPTASERILLVLALEVQAAWPAQAPRQSAGTHP